MEFRTIVDLPKRLPAIDHTHKLMLMGSCFSENIGQRLQSGKFDCDVNPFGILYNPLSVAVALRQILSGREYTPVDLVFHGEQHHSYMHHGSFSAGTAEETLRNINRRLREAHERVFRLDYLLITFGTSWIYSLKDGGRVVSNCHKLPAGTFDRRRLSVAEIIGGYTPLLQELQERNPALKIILTVSPIRHLKDGAHENQLSKSTLLLAIAGLQELFPQMVFYFPSYEIVMDELRDYRFYGEDMAHPSGTAIQYIWECFARVFFSKETLSILKEIETVLKALKHKPFDECSEGYRRFLKQIVLKIERLKEKYPYLDVQKELDLCHTRLK